MAARSLTWWMVKINRLTGWLLLPLMIVFIITGFAIVGKFGLNRWLSAEAAHRIHQVLTWPIIGIFCMHATLSVYFSLKRWGWIK